MKRVLLFVLMVLMLQVVGCDSKKALVGGDSKQLSKERAVEIAYNSLNEMYKSDVINKDTPKVEETEYTYKVTFDAKSDAILGPIIVAVNKKTLEAKTSLRD